MLNETWASLNTLDSPTRQYILKRSQIKIGRKFGLDIVVAQPAISNLHCIIRKGDDGCCFVEDQSTNGCYLNDVKMSKGAKLPLKDGDVVWLLHSSKTKEPFGLRFNSLAMKIKEDQQKLQRQLREKKQKEEEEEKNKKEQEQKQRREKEEEEKKWEEKRLAEQARLEKERELLNSLAKNIKEQITCAMCLQIMVLPVSCHPCNHRLCGPCLTSLVRDRKSQCISCRKQIVSAQRDAAFNSIIDEYFKSNPTEKKSQEELQQLRKKNMFEADAIEVYKLIHGKEPQNLPNKKAADIPVFDPNRCLDCSEERNGFKCSSTQRHVPCSTCTQPIPVRPDRRNTQQCALCDKYFCNLYFPRCWRLGNHLVRFVDTMPALTMLDVSLMRGNDYEFNAFRTYLNMIGIHNAVQLHQILMDDYKENGFKYLVDRKIMNMAGRLPNVIKLDKRSVVCDNCWGSLWFQLVFQFRMDIHDQLPGFVTSRPDCFYGINCTTMARNPMHAAKFNHCCYQTQF